MKTFLTFLIESSEWLNQVHIKDICNICNHFDWYISLLHEYIVVSYYCYTNPIHLIGNSPFINPLSLILSISWGSARRVSTYESRWDTIISQRVSKIQFFACCLSLPLFKHNPATHWAWWSLTTLIVLQNTDNTLLTSSVCIFETVFNRINDYVLVNNSYYKWAIKFKCPLYMYIKYLCS